MSLINTRDIIGDQATLDGLVAHTLTEFKEDGVNQLGDYALYSNSGLQYVEMPGVISASSAAFAGCINLISASLQNLQVFGWSMFYSCYSLADVYTPVVQSGSQRVFCRCSSLESVNFPQLRTTGAVMFSECIKLSYASFSPYISIVGQDMFAGCSALQSITFDTARQIYSSAFAGCRALKTAVFPSAYDILTNAFNGCMMLSSVSFPNAEYLRGSTFQSAPIFRFILPRATSIYAFAITSATEVDIGANVTITQSAFYKNTNLFALILRHTSMATLQNINALVGTPIETGCGKIYVPSGLVSTYQAGTNWVTYAQQIDSIDNYTDVAPLGGDTITDSWEIILSNENYATDYTIGDTKWLKTSIGYILMQIVAFDTDELSDNSGNAHITWLCKGYQQCMPMHDFVDYDVGWGGSTLRQWLSNEILPTINEAVRSEIKAVKKTSLLRDDSTSISDDYIWVPSIREITGTTTTSYESSGCDYTGFFTNDTSRTKYRAWTSIDANSWWLRSVSGQYFRAISEIGVGNRVITATSTTTGVVFGFCT